MKDVALRLGDCRDVLAKCKENCVDSIVVDPPYGLSKEPNIAEVLTHWLAGDDYVHSHKGFMGKSWDSFVPGPATWKEAFRVLKPGGYALVFAGTRTADLMGISLRMAGFEIRDTISWHYGSGFPKSLDVSKALDKSAGVDREMVGTGKGRTGASAQPNGGSVMSDDNYQGPGDFDITAPATDAAKQWEGWGTALKPATEPILVCRKPLSDGTVAANVLRWGTGGINIDGCRVSTEGAPRANGGLSGVHNESDVLGNGRLLKRVERPDEALGRFPANLIHDGSDEVLAAFPDAAGQQGVVSGNEPSCTGGEGTNCFGKYNRVGYRPPRIESDKSAARFFYCAKASKSDRGEGNNHPTVKPQALMRYLVRLVTPPNGLVLDCFMGSGSTGKAAIAEGFRFFGITDEQEHMTIAERRIQETSS